MDMLPFLVLWMRLKDWLIDQMCHHEQSSLSLLRIYLISGLTLIFEMTGGFEWEFLSTGGLGHSLGVHVIEIEG